MGGESTGTQQLSTTRTPTIGGAELQGILTGMGSIDPNLSGAETGALSRLQTSADQGSPFAAGLTGAANQAIGGGPQVLRDTLAGKFLDPNSNPFFSQLTDIIGNRARDLTNAQYAGSGRDPAGAGSYGQTIGRGVSEGLAPVFANAYAQERNNQMQGLGLDLANRTAGFDFANKAQQANDFGPLQTMMIEAQREGIPFERYLQMAGVALPTANAFASGTSNTTSTQNLSGADQFNKIATGIGSIGNLGKISNLWA